MGNDAPHKSDRDGAAKLQQSAAKLSQAQTAAAAFFELWQGSLRAAAKPFPISVEQDEK